MRAEIKMLARQLGWTNYSGGSEKWRERNGNGFEKLKRQNK